MLSLRNRFGIPGVISVIALVFAMFGGAYAANNSGGDATASAKQNKKAGKRGPRGPRGKQGPMGPAGPQGPAGAKGATGATGKNGADGKDGVSVTSEEFGTGGKDGKCVGAGGSKFVASSGNTYACNGKEGKAGKDGKDGTFSTEPLPSGETLTGVWSTATASAGEKVEDEVQVAAISYPIEVEPAPEVGYINEDQSEEFFYTIVNEEFPLVESRTPLCQGDANAPTAPPGHLCVYAAEGTEFSGFTGLSFTQTLSAGAFLGFELKPFGSPRGAWAVTAE